MEVSEELSTDWRGRPHFLKYILGSSSNPQILKFLKSPNPQILKFREPLFI